MLNFVRLMLLALTLAAGGTTAIWVYAPRAVGRIDSYLHWKWVGRFHEGLDRAEQLQYGGKHAEALELLVEMHESMDDVQVGDRLDYNWRRAMRLRIANHRALGQWTDAIACASEHRSHDPNDLPNLVTLAQLKIESEADPGAGLAILREVNHRFPEWGEGVEALGSALLDRGRDVEALEVGLAYLRRAAHMQAHDWTILWNDGTGYTNKHSRMIDLTRGSVPGDCAIDLQIPQGEGTLRRLRIEPPSWADFRARDWELVVSAAGAVVRLDRLDQLSAKSRVAAGPGGSIEAARHGTTSIEVEFDEPLALDGTARVGLSAWFEPILPSPFRQALETRLTEAPLDEWLRDVGRAADRELLGRAVGG